MGRVWRFLVKFASIFVCPLCPLHCFDRVIFKGHLAMAAPSELERFVDWVLKVHRCHFINDTGILKMYDKFGQILRVETVINRPKEFSVFRSRFHRDGTSSQGYFPMNKDTGSLIHYQAQALACNRRYLDALAVVDDPAPAYQQLRQLTEPKVVTERSYAGFNPARQEDVRLFLAILEGDHIARGFRNKEVRAALFGAEAKPTLRQSAAIGRLLKRLHTRHVVAKIPHSRRWRVTEPGRHLR